MFQANSVRARRGVLALLLVPSFYLAEWGLVAVTASLFSWLHYREIPDHLIWLLFWAGNLGLSVLFVLCNDLLRVDFTLMEKLSALLQVAARRSPSLAILLEAVIFVRLLLWDGPCQLLIFFRRRLPSPPVQALFLFAASGIQMFVWARLYALGYASISELWSP